MTVLILSLFPVLAQETPLFLSEADWIPSLEKIDREQLIETGEIFREIANGQEFTMFPGTETVPELESIKRDMRRYFGTETLLFLPSPVIPVNPEKKAAFLLDLYNLIRKVSTLEGMDYYSASRGHRRTLFNQFYAIDKPGSRTALADPLVKTIPSADTFLIFQNDATFGNAEYEITYRFDDPIVSLTMKNMTTLVYKIIPVAGKEKLFMYVRIIPVQEGFLFYGVCLVEGRDIPVFGKSTSDSLQNRVKALFEWFAKRVNIEMSTAY